MGAIGADIGEEKVVPLYAELYSQEADHFKSESIMILRTIDAVRSKTENKGILDIR